MTAERIIPISTNYTDRDFDSLRARIFELIRSVFPEWTDTSVANFGNLLIEMFCFVGDVLGFYQDNQAREAFVPSARLRKNLLALAKRTGYVPAGARAATADETFTLSAPAAATVTIPKGDRVKTADITTPLYYQLLEDLVFQPGETVKIATVENSEFATATFESSGLANQGFVLPAIPYIDDSAAVTAQNGEFTKPPLPNDDNFFASGPTDKHFLAFADQSDRATVRFGNGINGAIPVGTVSVTYKIGGGAAGRVEAGALNRLEKTYTDANGAPVKITVTNVFQSSGGIDRETNAQIATNIPKALRVLGRTIAREDAEIVAEKIPGVARALHVTSNEFAGIGENRGKLFIVPTAGGTPSSGLITQVKGQFAQNGPYPTTNTYQLDVTGAPYLRINVSALVYLKPGFSEEVVRASIMASLRSFFAIVLEDGTPNEKINFGYYFQDQDGNPTGLFAWDDIRTAIRNAAGVSKLDAGSAGLLLNGERADVPLDVFEFPELGDVVLINAKTGLEF